MASNITVNGWVTPPTDEQVLSLLGKVIHVEIMPEGKGPWSFADFFRYARVDEIRRRGVGQTACSRCKEVANWELVIAWEAEYVDLLGSTICEHCVVCEAEDPGFGFSK